MATTPRQWWERRKAAYALRNAPLFGRCAPAQLHEIDGLLTEVRVPAGRELIRQGERGLDFAIVVEGRAEVRRDGERLATLGPGSFFGEMALVDGGRRTATVTARTKMRLYVLSRREFDRLLEIVPGLRARVQAAADRRRQGNPVRAA